MSEYSLLNTKEFQPNSKESMVLGYAFSYTKIKAIPAR